MIAAVLALGLAVASPDANEDDGARRIAELIDEAANRGEFDSALVLVDEAERLYPHHRWRFFRASILSEKGDCEAAIPEYEAYIAQEDVSANVGSAQAALDECREELEGASAPEHAPPVKVEPTPPAPIPIDKPTKRQPKWHRDPAGIALLTSGLAVGVAGTIIFFQGVSRRNRAENEQQLEDFESGLRRAQILGGVGIATIAVGSALAIGGIVRFAVVARRPKQDVALRSPLFFRF